LGKLGEEVEELRGTSRKEWAEELVDIIEVCFAMAYHGCGVTRDQLLDLTSAKQAERGAFIDLTRLVNASND
jgi:predicted house-cleaning noncanonical NTP pyrophosphatase (MazG superfamily)